MSNEERIPSPTAGMNIAQRILHVGGRNNDAGYVEFGSIQAVEALVRQVLRDRRDLIAEKPELTVTACYFPKKGEADLTWERKDCGARFGMTVAVTEEQGKALSDVIWPCVFWNADAGHSEPNIDAAAKALAGAMDYPWDAMPAEGRENMRKHAKVIIDAAMAGE